MTASSGRPPYQERALPPDLELARRFAETATALAAHPTLDRTLSEVVALAVATVPGADAAGVTIVRDKAVETPAATDDVVLACDAAQYATGDGPCLRAMWHDRTVRVDEMRTDGRWPRFAARAASLGVRSMLACQLSGRPGTLSALNLYAYEPSAFDDRARELVLVFAAHAAIALESTQVEADLRAAVDTRQDIGQAVGILMERHKFTGKQAFDLLVSASQRLNVKLRVLADVVVSTGMDPTRDGRDIARLVTIKQRIDRDAGEPEPV